MRDVGTGKDDQNLDAALRSWANDAPRSDAFMARLNAIPEQHPRRVKGILTRIIGAMGGWGFAAPQLAGLVLAAWLGIASGSQAVADEDLVTEAMGEHIFGSDELYEG